MLLFDNFWRQETLLTIVSLLFLLPGCHADKQSNYPPETITKSNQDFTFNLYKEVVQSETGNICLSPFSVSFCLGMIMNGTERDTYDEIRQLMGFQDKDGDINEIIAHLDKEQWEKWLNNLSLHKFELHLPRFKMEQKINLEKQLKALGIKKAFIASLACFNVQNNIAKEVFLIHGWTNNGFDFT